MNTVEAIAFYYIARESQRKSKTPPKKQKLQPKSQSENLVNSSLEIELTKI